MESMSRLEQIVARFAGRDTRAPGDPLLSAPSPGAIPEPRPARTRGCSPRGRLFSSCVKADRPCPLAWKHRCVPLGCDYAPAGIDPCGLVAPLPLKAR
jgi:hypothetical protein